LSATGSVIERPVSADPAEPLDVSEARAARPTGLVALLRRQPRGVLTAAGLLLAAALAVLDLATPPNLSFLIFYIAPVLFLIWFVGRGAALLATALAAGVWTYEDVLSAGGQSSPALAIWSVVTRFGFFVLFVEIVERLKAALERSHRAEQREMEREVEIAQAVQLRLFPQTAPSAPGLDCHGVCRPVRGVAGDYYDFLPLGPGKLGIAVGDVAGKGISAALLMASLQASLRSYISVSRDGMADVTREMNRQLFALTEPTRFATLFWGIYDEWARTFRYVNAGHDPPFLLRRAFGNGSEKPVEVQRLTAGGLPLGAFADSEYREAAIALEAGDLIAIYTDGITETVDAAEQEFGVARLEELLRMNANHPAAQICRRVLETVDGFRSGSPQHDDMTLLIVRVPAGATAAALQE
jgi:serine phosphatase RsbU (regulator of sigma subunit)